MAPRITGQSNTQNQPQQSQQTGPGKKVNMTDEELLASRGGDALKKLDAVNALAAKPEAWQQQVKDKWDPKPGESIIGLYLGTDPHADSRYLEHMFAVKEDGKTVIKRRQGDRILSKEIRRNGGKGTFMKVKFLGLVQKDDGNGTVLSEYNDYVVEKLAQPV